MFNLASFRVIFDHFTQLQELIMECPGSELGNMLFSDYLTTDMLTVGQMLSSHGVACCMSTTDPDEKVYICPTADLVEKTCQRSFYSDHFMYFCGCIHQEALKNLGKITQLVTHACISIERDPRDNKELSEEDVAAANYILDLLADSSRSSSSRRGRLLFVVLPEVNITDSG